MKARIIPKAGGRFYITDLQQEKGAFRGVACGDLVKYGGNLYKITRTPQSCYDGRLIYTVDTIKI